ncbi:hypothetical protein ACLKA7_007997 [Drosophila subpalustris]
MPPPDVGQLMPNGFQVSSPIMRITAATTDTANKIRLPAAGSFSILYLNPTHTPMPTGNTNTNAFKSDAPTPSHFQLAALVLILEPRAYAKPHKIVEAPQLSLHLEWDRLPPEDLRPIAKNFKSRLDLCIATG